MFIEGREGWVNENDFIEIQNWDGTQRKVKVGMCMHMGESFQDYSWIQDFEPDFPQKVSLKMLN